MIGDHAPLRIGSVLPRDRVPTLELVFSHLDVEDRSRHIAEATACSVCGTSDPFEGLIAAKRNGQLVGAVFSQIGVDRTAIVWLPRLVEGEPLSTAAELCTATWAFLGRYHVCYAQSLLPTINSSDQKLLQMGGMGHLANLLYLVSQESVFPNAPPSIQLELQPYCESQRQRWAEVFESTCEETLDCANWEDARSGEDALAGYRSAGAFDPNLWLLAWREEDQPIGCLLLANHPQHGNMELQYLGVIPAARGYGFGKQLAAHAQWLARLAGCQRLVLAVDAANKPAIQTYMALGFQAWQQRRLYVRRLHSADNWHTGSEQFFPRWSPEDGGEFGSDENTELRVFSEDFALELFWVRILHP